MKKKETEFRNPKQFKKSILILTICIAIVIVLAVTAYLLIGNSNMKKFWGITTTSPNYQYITGTYTDILVTDDVTAIAAAKEASTILGLQNASDELKFISKTSASDLNIYYLQEFKKGIPIFNSKISITTDKNGVVQGFNSTLVDFTIEEVTPSISQENINEIIIKNYGDSSSTKNVSNEDLIFYNNDGNWILSFLIPVYNNGISTKQIIIDSIEGKILSSFSNINNSSTTGYNSDKSISFDVTLENNNYYLWDENKRIYEYNSNGYNYDRDGFGNASYVVSSNNIFGDTKEEKEKKYDEGATIFHNVNQIYDFYFKKFEIGIPANYDNLLVTYNDASETQGGSITYNNSENCSGIIIIGYNNYNNDFSVLAHEYTHVITKGIVNFNSDEIQNQALCEAYSDIMACLSNTSINRSSQWNIVDRNIADPKSSNYPDSVNDANNGFHLFQVHNQYFYSTIISHAAYLMSTGVNGGQMALTNAELSKLWVFSMYYLPSNATFSDCRRAVEQSAEILNYSQELRNCIASAFDTVGVTVSNENNSIVECKPGSLLKVRDKNGKLLGYYQLEIEGQKDQIQGKKEGIPLNLEEGEYTLTIHDDNNYEHTFQKQIRVSNSAVLKEVTVLTDFVPPAYTKLYQAEIEKYIRAINEKWSTTKLSEEKIFYTINGRILDDLGYYLTDLDNDQMKELIIYLIKPDKTSGYIFTLDTFLNNELKTIARSADSNYFYLRNDNQIFATRGGPGNFVYKVNNGNLDEVIGLVEDNGFSPDDPRHYMIHNMNNNQWEIISKDEYNSYYEKYFDDDMLTKNIPGTPLSQYSPENI